MRCIPEARIQLCIGHMVRNSLRFVSYSPNCDRFRGHFERIYLVNGKPVVQIKAATLLGYSTGDALSRVLARAGIESGGKIGRIVNNVPATGKKVAQYTLLTGRLF